MSIEASAWAWQQHTDNSGQRLVLLALCDHMADHEDHEGLTAWPSVARLATMCQLSSSTVRTHLDALCEAGTVTKVERRRRKSGTLGTWRYRVNVHESTSADPSAVVTSADPSAHESADTSAVDQRRPIGALEPLSLNRDIETPQEGASPADQLAIAMADMIEARGNKRPSVTQEWITDMDRLMRLDGRTPDQIEHVLRWLHTAPDDTARFWQPNIRSPKKLRAQWDQMAEQYKRDRQRNTPGGTSVMDRIRNANTRQPGDGESRLLA